PGRLRLVTRPSWTGSTATKNTIGIVVVAVRAASTAGVLVETMTEKYSSIASRQTRREELLHDRMVGIRRRPERLPAEIADVGQNFLHVGNSQSGRPARCAVRSRTCVPSRPPS